MIKRTVMTAVLGLSAILVLAGPVGAVALLDWTVAFESKTVDGPRSAANVGGFDSWVIWTYRVTANTDTGSDPGEFSHLVIGLPDLSYVNDTMFISDGIEDSADTVPSGFYGIQFRSTASGPLRLRGMEWNNESDRVTEEDDFDFFFFSTPDVPIALVDVGLKRGGGRVYGLIEGPGSPIPEPSSMLLLGSGLAGFGFFRRRKHA